MSAVQRSHATVAGDKGGAAVTVSTNVKVPASGGKAPTTHSIPGEKRKENKNDKEKTKGGWTERWAPPRVGRRHFSAVARSGASWRETEDTNINSYNLKVLENLISAFLGRFWQVGLAV